MDKYGQANDEKHRKKEWEMKEGWKLRKNKNFYFFFQ